MTCYTSKMNVTKIVQEQKLLQKELEENDIPSSERIKKEKLLKGNYKKYKIAQDIITLQKELMQELSEEDKELFQQELDALMQQLTKLDTPALQTQEIMLEIRPGVGGDEASLFALNLVNMYKQYIESKKWEYSVLHTSFSNVNGIREIIINIIGEGVYHFLQNESGVHRIQRIPQTESNGRVHTSTATVAVLNVKATEECTLDTSKLQVDVYRSSGAGGQSVNKTESAVRITYDDEIAGRIVVCMQNERSQHQNKEQALKVLQARIMQKRIEEQHVKQAKERKNQIGQGRRNEKIRTYHIPERRVTDHRSNCKLHNINDKTLLDSDALQTMINSLLE